MKMKTISLLFLLTIISLSSFSQLKRDEVNELIELKWKQKLKVGDNLFERGSYYNAIEVYELVWKDKPGNTDVAYKIGVASYHMSDYNGAKTWFNNLMSLDSIEYPTALYYYAASLKGLGEYTEAKEYFERFKKSEIKKSTEETDGLKLKVDNEIEGCEFGIEVTSDPEKVTIENIAAINHPVSDYSPYFVGDDKLLFSSWAGDSMINIKDSISKDERYARILISKKEEDGSWGAPTLFSQSFNDGKYNITNAVFSPDGKMVFFTKCRDNVEGDLNQAQCQIYTSSYNSGVWSDALLVGGNINGDEFQSTHPYIVKLENGTIVMYYSSNRTGGSGGMDIYKSVLGGDGNFTDGENVSTVNTSGDEFTPFFDPIKKVLYYSTDGMPTIGGLDIYYSVLADGKLGEPTHAGYPLNSSVNDLYFRYREKPNKGVLVSNRSGSEYVKYEMCCDDIWSFFYPPKIVSVEARILDEDTDSMIEGPGFLYVYQLDNDSLIASYDMGEDGKFNFRLKGGKQYKLVASGDRYGEAEHTIDAEDAEEDQVFKKDFYLKKKDFWAGKQLGVVYYEYNKARLKKEARTTLADVVEFLNKFPEVKLEVQGHTDSIGDEEYNQKLSERRAEAVYNFLVKKDIDAERLTQKGYSESKPAAPNSLPDGKDNPEGRELNRRTEFVILNTQEKVQE